MTYYLIFKNRRKKKNKFANILVTATRRGRFLELYLNSGIKI